MLAKVGEAQLIHAKILSECAWLINVIPTAPEDMQNELRALLKQKEALSKEIEGKLITTTVEIPINAEKYVLEPIKEEPILVEEKVL